MRLILVSLCLVLGALVAPAQASEEGCPGLIASRRLPVIPAGLATGEVGLTYVGHSTFLIETASGLTLATDYNDYVRPRITPDIVTMNRAHSTHYSDNPDPGIKTILRGWSPSGGDAPRYDQQFADLRIRNVVTNIRQWGGETTIMQGNSIFVFEAADLCIAHLGHLHHTLTPEHLKQLGRIDVVLVPVDGSYTLDIDGMMEVLSAMSPKLMVPMHFFGQSTLSRFLEKAREKGWDVARNETPHLTLSRAMLPGTPRVVRAARPLTLAGRAPPWHERIVTTPSPARALLSAAAVRERAHALLALGLDGKLAHFTVDPGRLEACADIVIVTMRDEYPTLEIPFHARWRHFTAGGLDRWGTLQEAIRFPDLREQARAAFDLAITSVLLDAGAGAAWRYEEGRTGETYSRSEGLAVASFDLFVGGALSADPETPCRADADALAGLAVTELARAFQVGPANPLVGLEGRTALLNRLGQAVAAKPEVFGLADRPRPGGLFDWLVAEAPGEEIAAPAILEALLLHLGPVWPGRITLDGLDLGDTWRHPLAPGAGKTAGLVPFHKLSQWLAYSLIEPLEEAGIRVSDLDGLTGLPEYRNGGLFLDTGVLALRDPGAAGHPHAVGSELVVEWRALTVALIDRLAEIIRTKLDLDAEAFPLAKVLEGGTWAAGRRLARAKRGGEPPLRVESDGTVF